MNVSEESFTGYEKENIAVLQFHRDFLLRTENLSGRDQVLDFLDRVSASRSIKLLIIAGAPDAKGREEFNEFFDRFYAKGMDLTLIHRMNNVISQLVLKLAQLKKFIIYMNSNKIVATFLNVGLACDYRIIADNAVIQNPCVDMGIVSKGGGAYFMPKLIGRGKTIEVMLSDRDITAQEAKDLGLINDIVPYENLEAFTFTKAKEFAQKPMSSLLAVKQLLNFSIRGLKDYLDYENELIINIVQNPDYRRS